MNSPMPLSDEEIKEALDKQWGKGFTVKVRQVIRKNSFRMTLVLYKVKCHRDGCVEYRCKGWGSNQGWDYVTRTVF